MNNSKFYQTKQKSVIQAFLIHHKDEHLTAEDMLERLKSNDTPVGKATLYRFLDTLVSGGVVKKYLIDNNCSCFQYIGEDQKADEHYHFKCNCCGTLYHIDSPLLSKAESAIAKQFDFEIDQKRTVFYGTCQTCRRKPQ